MATYSLNGAPILQGQLRLAVRGNWVAELELDAAHGASVVEGTPARVVGQGVTLLGFLRQAGAFAGRIKAKVVGGAGKLARTLPQRHYVAEVPALDVVRDILDDAGEQLAAGVSLDDAVPRWIRAEDTAAAGLDAIADEIEGGTWRVLGDGKIWIGRDTWPASKVTPRRLEIDKRRKVMKVDAPLGMYPGETILGEHATSIVYQVTGAPRAEVHFGATEREDLAAAIARMGPRPLYRVPYAATIVANQPDGSVDLVCDDKRMGAIVAVPLSGILPGCRVVPLVGSRVRLTFDAGDPSKYSASIFDADAAAARGVARVGDLVHAGWIKVTCAAPGSPGLIEYLAPETPAELRPGFTALDLARVAEGSAMVALR